MSIKRSRSGRSSEFVDSGIHSIIDATGSGDFTDVQSALNAGYYDLYIRTPLTVDQTIMLPDSDTFMLFAPEATITPVSASAGVAVFTVPDGLTEIRYYHFKHCRIESDGVTDQTVLEIADTGGFANVTFHDPYIEYPDTLINFSGYDLTFTHTHRVTFLGGSVLPRVGNTSTLAMTPNPGGTYAGATIVTFDGCYLFDDAISYATQLWYANFEGDIHLNRTAIGFKEGSEFGGPVAYNGILTLGNGDINFDGTYYGSNSTIKNLILNSIGADCRANIWDVGAVIEPGYMYNVALKFHGHTPRFRDTYCLDSIGLTNPGVELFGTDAASAGNITGIEFVTFGGGTFPNGCIKITDSNFNKVHDCHFSASVTARTVEETGTSDKNCIYDNTGVNNGTGTLVNINGNDQVHNNIN